jgi:hypothetical protein
MRAVELKLQRPTYLEVGNPLIVSYVEHGHRTIPACANDNVLCIIAARHARDRPRHVIMVSAHCCQAGPIEE